MATYNVPTPSISKDKGGPRPPYGDMTPTLLYKVHTPVFGFEKTMRRNKKRTKYIYIYAIVPLNIKALCLAVCYALLLLPYYWNLLFAQTTSLYNGF